MAFKIFIATIILLRIGELLLAQSNERWARTHGAVEYGAAHYPIMVALHASFLVALILEYAWRGPLPYHALLIISYAILVLLKVWVISSLGRFWNTKILRIPDAPLITGGPYRFMRHPNYVIVVCEIAVIPLAFSLWYTAIIFSILNAAMLYIRISEENRALRDIL